MMRQHLGSLWRDDSGQAATEYILIIGLISIPIYVLFKVAFEKFLSDFVAALVESFTRG